MSDPLLIGLIAFVAVVGFVAVKYLLLWLVLRDGPGSRPEPTSGPTSLGFLLFFTLVWTAVIGTADFQIGRNAFRQARTHGFAADDGEVRSCRVMAASDGEGTSYDVEVEYAYRVGDATFAGTCVRYSPMWDHASATAFNADHPPGSKIPVYFNPDDPAEAVLEPGLDGRELFIALMLLPFNLVMVGSWAAVAHARRTGRLRPSDRLDPVISGGSEERVRLRPNSAAGAAAGILFVGPIVCTLFVAFCAGMPPSTEVMVGVWVVLLGAAGIVTRNERHRPKGRCP